MKPDYNLTLDIRKDSTNFTINKYGGIMSVKDFNFIESSLPSENFKFLPTIPIILRDGENKMLIKGLIDSGATNSFIDVFYAKEIKGTIIDSIRTTGVTSTVEDKPVIEVEISNKSMDGKWVTLMVGVIDTHHPNFNIILGRDFMEMFKQITFDQENQKTILNF